MRNQPFESGDTIEFCDELFIVIENYGKSGRVRECGTTTVIDNFFWEFENDNCKLIEKGK